MNMQIAQLDNFGIRPWQNQVMTGFTTPYGVVTHRGGTADASYYGYKMFGNYDNTSAGAKLNKNQGGAPFAQLAIGKTVMINNIYTPKVSFDLGYGQPSTWQWSVFLYKGGSQVYSRTCNGLNTSFTIPLTICDTILIYNIQSNNPDWTSNSAFKFTGLQF